MIKPKTRQYSSRVFFALVFGFDCATNILRLGLDSDWILGPLGDFSLLLV